MKRLLRTIAGVVAGYAIMVVLITLVQETWFGGVGLRQSSLGVLLTAGLLTSIAGGIGAIAAAVIARPLGRVAAMIMACLVVTETTTLTLTGRLSGPLWFDLVAAGTLIASILLGAELWLRVGSDNRRSQAA